MSAHEKISRLPPRIAGSNFPDPKIARGGKGEEEKRAARMKDEERGDILSDWGPVTKQIPSRTVLLTKNFCRKI